MTRPIKFRGKRKDNGEWVYGDLMSDGRSYWIVGPVVDASEEYISPEWWAPIIKETLGQFTGLLDREGKEIWEGGIVREHRSGGYSGKPYHIDSEVEFFNGKFDPFNECECTASDHSEGYEILGNIYDNPELTK